MNKRHKQLRRKPHPFFMMYLGKWEEKAGIDQRAALHNTHTRTHTHTHTHLIIFILAHHLLHKFKMLLVYYIHFDKLNSQDFSQVAYLLTAVLLP